MKRTIIIAIALLALSVQSCIVISVHPFYTEDDIVFKKQFEGEWTDQENNHWRILQNPLKPNSYQLRSSKNGREVALLGHLFTIDNNMYLDLVPLEDNSEEFLLFDLHMVPTHSIARVMVLTDKEVDIKWFNEEWLRKMFTENRIRISHEMITDEDPKKKESGMYLLTASTKELQGFIRKYGTEKEAYDDLKLKLTK